MQTSSGENDLQSEAACLRCSENEVIEVKS